MHRTAACKYQIKITFNKHIVKENCSTVALAHMEIEIYNVIYIPAVDEQPHKF